MRHTFKGLVVVAGTLLLAPWTRAQAPITQGEAQARRTEVERVAESRMQASGMLAGQVVGPRGEPLPAVTIEVVASDGSLKVTMTGADGRFQVAGLPKGPASLKASLVDFGFVQRDVTVGAEQSTQISLTMGGSVVQRVVPPAESGPGGDGGSPGEQPPAPEPAAARTVVERQFSDDIVLQDFLDDFTAEGLELDAVVPVETGKSLFVFKGREAAAASIVIFDSSADRDPVRLTKRLDQHSGKRFLGIHRLRPGAAALVFRDGDGP